MLRLTRSLFCNHNRKRARCAHFTCSSVVAKSLNRLEHDFVENDKNTTQIIKDYMWPLIKSIAMPGDGFDTNKHKREEMFILVTQRVGITWSRNMFYDYYFDLLALSRSHSWRLSISRSVNPFLRPRLSISFCAQKVVVSWFTKSPQFTPL